MNVVRDVNDGENEGDDQTEASKYQDKPSTNLEYLFLLECLFSMLHHVCVDAVQRTDLSQFNVELKDHPRLNKADFNLSHRLNQAQGVHVVIVFGYRRDFWPYREDYWYQARNDRDEAVNIEGHQ